MLNIDERLRAPSTGSTQISLTEDEKKFFSEDNNFIEYFLEIGIKPDIFANNNIPIESNLYEINSKLKPEIISKFPFFDKKSMSIDSTIIDYVFPNGFRAITSQTIPKPEFFSLILDNQFYSSVYSYKYIACLIIYENLIIYKQIYDSYSNKSNDTSNVTINAFNNIYVPKCLCLASVHPSLNKFELILNSIYTTYGMHEHFFLDLLIEKLICLTPKIPRGFKKVHLKIGNNFIDLTETKMNELPTINTNLKELFSLFKIDKIIDIFKFILYEMKIVFFSCKIRDVTNTIMSFLQLLNPFTYQYRILSVLPKKCYYFIEDENPCIFGVNETFFNSFFEDNKLLIDKIVICVVDIDRKDYYLKYAGGNISAKSYPLIPKHLKEKIDKRVEEFKKSKKKEETSEGYQEIFFRFMINLLKDYPKYLKKSFNGNSNKLQDMIDKEAYINAQNSGEKEFYKKIIESQMFYELIAKRMMPKDYREKMQALFFEEKLNVKHAQKKLIRSNKILEQNVLLPSRDYDYEEPGIIIDSYETNASFNELDSNTVNFFHNYNYINKEICLPRGYKVMPGNTKNALCFYYYLFPILLSEKLFKFNCKHYTVPQNLNLKIIKKNEDIIHNCFIKFDDGKKTKSGELQNDLYICYLVLFSLSLWYTDKEERDARFKNLLVILTIMEKHDMEAIELLFKTLINLGEEQLAYNLYKKFNRMHINLTWTIFSLMSKILHKKQNIYSGSIKENNERDSMTFTNININNFRTRSIKLPDIDDDILGEEILFEPFGVCLECRSQINLGKICTNLSIKELDKSNRFRCRCGNSSLQKLNFKIGTELYNQMISKDSSSVKKGIVLYSPTTLKKKLLYLSNLYSNSKFDVEKFSINYPDEFWNSIWYFQLKGIDISFILPYVKPVKIKKFVGANNINNFINFITDTTYDHFNKEFKNPNNKVEKVKINKIKYNNDNIFIQHVYQISIIKIIGMIIYKPIDIYTGNISFNEKILMVTDSKKKNKTDFEEIKEAKEKPKKSIMYSNSITVTDYELNNSSNAFLIDNSVEYNKDIDGNLNIEEDNENNNKGKNGKQSKVHFSSEEMFENIKEDDSCYDIFKDYREEDDDNEDDY